MGMSSVKIDKNGYITGLGLTGYDIELVDYEGVTIEGTQRSFFGAGFPVNLYSQYRRHNARIKVNGEIICELNSVLE